MKQYKYWSDGYDSGLMPFPKKEYEDKKVIFVEDLRKLLEKRIQFYDEKIAKEIYLRFCERRNECFRLLAELKESPRKRSCLEKEE